MNYFATFLASFLIWFMMGALFVYWLLQKKIRGYQIMHIMAIVVAAFLLSTLIKELFPSPRPFLVYGTNPLTVTVPQDSAFPSTHTSVSFAMVFGALYHSRRLGLFFLAPAILVGLGRIMTNVHYPIDIVGGIFVALLMAVLFNHKGLLKYFQRPWITT